MFRGDGQSVEENQEDDQPIENLRFNCCSTLPSAQSVPPSRVATEKERLRERRRKGEEMWGRERRKGNDERWEKREREVGRSETG